MNMHTFSLKAAQVVARIEDTPLGGIMDRVKPGIVNAVGMVSGGSGVALASQWAEQLQPIAALFATLVAVLGGCFYAVYWLYRMLRERLAYKNGEPILTGKKKG